MGLTNGFTRIVLSGRLQRHQAESITVVRSKSSVFEDKSSFGDYAELTAGLAPPLYSGFLQRQVRQFTGW